MSDEAFNSIPLHLESTAFPTAEPQALELATHGLVGDGDNSLIGGFVVTGADPKIVVLRALGPTLGGSGVTGVVADPVLTIYDDTGAPIATNDNWQNDLSAPQIMENGLAPSDAAESATILHLPAGAYSAIVRGTNAGAGVGLVEVYDLE